MRSSQTLDSSRGGFVSFFNELDTGKELCSDSVSCLRKLETKNYACYKFACPQHNDENQGTCPPSFIAQCGGWNEALLSRSWKDLWELFHFLVRLTQGKNYPQLLSTIYLTKTLL